MKSSTRVKYWGIVDSDIYRIYNYNYFQTTNSILETISHRCIKWYLFHSYNHELRTWKTIPCIHINQSTMTHAVFFFSTLLYTLRISGIANKQKKNQFWVALINQIWFMPHANKYGSFYQINEKNISFPRMPNVIIIIFRNSEAFCNVKCMGFGQQLKIVQNKDVTYFQCVRTFSINVEH